MVAVAVRIRDKIEIRIWRRVLTYIRHANTISCLSWGNMAPRMSMLQRYIENHTDRSQFPNFYVIRSEFAASCWNTRSLPLRHILSHSSSNKCARFFIVTAAITPVTVIESYFDALCIGFSLMHKTQIVLAPLSHLNKCVFRNWAMKRTTSLSLLPSHKAILIYMIYGSTSFF